MKIIHARALSLLAAIAFAPALCGAASKYPAERTEPAHAKAMIRYNAGDLPRAQGILDELLVDYPDYVPALELKALILRRQGHDARALKIYERLISLAESPKKAAPYHFDLASIHFGEKRFSDARTHFETSIRSRFNWGAAHYFLGLMDYESGDLTSAEFHFNATWWSTAQDLKPMAAFYLGIIHAKMGHMPGVIYGFKAADDNANHIVRTGGPEAKKAAEGVKKVTTEALKNFRHDRFYGSLLLQAQYDSNLPILPDAIANQQPSNKKSMKGIAAATLGFTSSPLRKVQVTAAYRNYYNYNFNKDAKGYSFFSNMPSAVVSFFPYKRISPGIKLEGNLTYNDRFENGHTIFRPFSLIGNVGPFVRMEYVPRLITTFEVTFRPKKYYLDPTSDSQKDLKRTGNGVAMRLGWEWNSLKSWLNPQGYFGYEYDNTDGREFNAIIWSTGLANAFKLTDLDVLTLAIDVNRQRFGERVGAVRVDRYMSYRALFTHVVSSHLTLLLDASFTRNLSTVADVYQYNRFISSVGASLSI